MPTKQATGLALVALTAVAAGCLVDGRYGYGRNRDHRRDSVWEIVRSDPCRHEEYQRFAQEHSNPTKRRRFTEHLAREGCSLDHYDHRGYDQR